jgi:hypothetical protein
MEFGVRGSVEGAVGSRSNEARDCILRRSQRIDTHALILEASDWRYAPPLADRCAGSQDSSQGWIATGALAQIAPPHVSVPSYSWMFWTALKKKAAYLPG